MSPASAQPVEFWLVDARRAKRDVDEWTSHDGTIRVYRGAFASGAWCFEVRAHGGGELLTIWAGFATSEEALRIAEMYAARGAAYALEVWRSLIVKRGEQARKPVAEQLGLPG